MAGYKRLTDAIIGMMQAVIAANVKGEAREKIGESVMARLFGEEDESQRRADIVLTPLGFLQKRLFEGYSEIEASRSALLDISIYISMFPYRHERITRPRHLRYHIENYLSETFVLRERLVAYTTSIWRAYRKDERATEVKKNMLRVEEEARARLDGITSTRSAHVHSARFEYPDLRRLELMELFDRNPFDEDFAPTLRAYYLMEYRRIRSSWRKRLTENNDQIQKNRG